MRKIGIIPNITRDAGLQSTKKICEWLQLHGCEVLLDEENAEILQVPSVSLERVYRDSEFLIVLGGDGTMLRAAQSAAAYQKPLLGINTGTLGYLSFSEFCDYEDALKKVLDGNYKTERRMMLEVTRTGDPHKLLALNETCITRGNFLKLIRLDLFINDEYIDTYRADGIIVCTPTGSTAYNLSAGGPTLKPDAEMLCVTPVCPHMLYARPIFISSNDVVKLKVMDNENREDCSLSLDGQHTCTLNHADEIIIKRSELYTSIMKSRELSFFEVLRNKMVDRPNGGSRL